MFAFYYIFSYPSTSTDVSSGIRQRQYYIDKKLSGLPIRGDSSHFRNTRRRPSGIFLVRLLAVESKFFSSSSVAVETENVSSRSSANVAGVGFPESSDHQFLLLVPAGVIFPFRRFPARCPARLGRVLFVLCFYVRSTTFYSRTFLFYGSTILVRQQYWYVIFECSRLRFFFFSYRSPIYYRQ